MLPGSRCAAHTGANHEITFAGEDRLQQLPHFGRHIAAVAVHEDQDVDSCRQQRPRRRRLGHIHAAARLPPWRRLPRLSCGCVGAAVVHHDAFADQIPGHFPDHRGDVLRLIQCWNDNRNPVAQIRGSSAGRNWSRPGAAADSATRDGIPGIFRRSRFRAWSVGWRCPR